MLDILIDESSSILDVLKKITKSGLGIVFVTNEKKVIGTITDGDIRRKISERGSIELTLSEVVNKKFRFVTVMSSPEEVQRTFDEGVECIPLLDLNGNLIRILERHERPVIPVCEPNLGTEEKRIIAEVLDSGWISSTGRFVYELESIFANYVGVKHAVAVSNGTLGLVLALKLLDVGEGDEVIVPDLTFGATANAVIQCGAKPIFVDIEADSYSINLEQIKQVISPKTKVILPVHLYGYPVNMIELCQFAQQHEIKVIEDAAEAIGSRINGKHVGSFGDVGVFSFYANKTITTGEGGMIVFNDSALLEAANKMRAHGFSSKRRYWHDTWGSNFRLTNLQAGLGVAQMSRVDDFVDAKVSINQFYQEHLVAKVDEVIQFPTTRKGVFDSHWLSVIQFEKSIEVDQLTNFLQINGVETRRVFYPLHVQPAFAPFVKHEESFPHATRVHNHGLCLPSSTNIKMDELEKVCLLIIKYLEGI